MNHLHQLYQVIWQSRPLMQAAEAAVERGLEGSGLTVRMRAVLEILADGGAATVPDVAQRLEIKRQYVQLMINDTHAAGFTEAVPNPRHQRSKLIALTEAGQRLITQVMEREKELLQTIGSDLPEDELAITLKTMQRLIARLKSNTEEHAP
ncbi:winged helix-turn-helix transcriptional regulator [Sulfitobacter mediterraneus]|nr:MarR family winged helix-turn-helix transcriptional regulator [Sulfitobacter mediterraneus]MBM1556330.1 winged helix-turn-helix transcriptional regulator [Sulfitobacter mediterraneus]MBM1567632.1 winged helix-turn-helix transcriptional regulator [Sulfitobacter mediterraneus]MBM1571684.1 winged helix-turn-helix transcriptional regulator [Sulfitobacter mediterraneus]MBM1575472.1 winged helix-turn-helix transcriptional regulator [Sulfitobacter mediterraneus]MBM1579037.1 winged helix-turn-helix